MGSQSVVISSHRELVLDGRATELKLQTFSGATSQLWNFEPAGLGTQRIINKENGKAIDIQGGIIAYANIILHIKHEGENQKWYINSDHTIESSSGNLALDVDLASFAPGTLIKAHPKHQGDNQKFYIENV